jgi:ankyrin repeat protein
VLAFAGWALLIWYRHTPLIGFGLLAPRVVPFLYVLCVGPALLLALMGWQLRRPDWRLAAFAGIVAIGLAAMVPHARTRYSTTDLVNAAKDGDIESVKSCLADGVPVNSRAKWGWYLENDGDNALSAAALLGRFEIVKYLLEHGANPSPKDGWNAPLFNAVVRKDAEMVALLLDHAADPNDMSGLNRPLLYEVADNGDASIARLLLNAGAKVKVHWTIYTDRGIETADAQTLIEHAAATGHQDVAQLFRDALGREKTRPVRNSG